MRGLKFPVLNAIYVIKSVAPYTGAWIEIDRFATIDTAKIVAPYTGAWIEMINPLYTLHRYPSHPTRVRGLK